MEDEGCCERFGYVGYLVVIVGVEWVVVFGVVFFVGGGDEFVFWCY